MDGKGVKNTVTYYQQLSSDKLPAVGLIKKKGRGNGGVEYYSDFGVIDTEWTNISDTDGRGCGLVYIWQFCLFGKVYYGRSLDDLVVFYRNVVSTLGLNQKRKLVVYVHNASADLQFLQSWIPFKEIKAISERKILSAVTYEGVEFRCSYLLSNMSLKKFLENMKVEHQKLPDYDYDGIRTPDSILTDEEMAYAENDVIGLYEAIHIRMEKDGDDIITIPATATGYVRRFVRGECNKDKHYHRVIMDQRLTAKQYGECKAAFRGGNTHANRRLAGKVIKEVRSFDITSCYPAACVYEDYPMGAFYATDDPIGSIESGYAVLMRVRFRNLETEAPIPYLSISKCTTDIGLISLRPDLHKAMFQVDNGRILRAGGWTETVINEVDYQIICKCYRWDDFEVVTAYKAKKGKLPEPIRKSICALFAEKTLLKREENLQYEYMKSKNMLNATYGMMVMDPVRDIVEVEEGHWTTERPANVSEELDKYYKRRSSFLSYQWGVWVTSYARSYLQEVIDLCGDNVVYCDTDSVKFITDDSIIAEIMKINERIQKRAEEETKNGFECMAWTKETSEHKSELQVLGLWDDEGLYTEFKTFGAKKYAFVKKGAFKFVVSGLGKKAISEIKCMDDFILGKEVVNSGRTCSWYDDDFSPHYLKINGKEYEVRSSLCITDTTYTLGVTDEYLDLVEEIGKTYERVKLGKKKILRFKSSCGFDLTL